MGLFIRNTLAVLPAGDGHAAGRHDVYIEGGDIALGSLALDFRLIGQRFSIPSMTLLSTPDGKVSGEFASVTKSPRRAESAAVEYGAAKAEMQFRQSTLIIFR